MARTTRSRSRRPAAGPAAGLTDAMLLDLWESTRSSLDCAHGEAEVKYAAALAALELEAARRGLALPAVAGREQPASPPQEARPEDEIPRLHLVLGAGGEAAVWELLGELGAEGLFEAWQVANSVPEPPLRLSRLTALCLVLDCRLFGEDTAEQRHRSYGLYPGSVEAKTQLVNDAIAASFGLLRLRLLR